MGKARRRSQSRHYASFSADSSTSLRRFALSVSGQTPERKSLILWVRDKLDPAGGRTMVAGTDMLRVLAVDDDAAIADSLADILNANGFHAKAVHSAEAAIEESVLLAPDVLITDGVMTGMSGIDLAIHISNTVPTCKIILFSGQPQTANLLAEAEARGYRFDLLQKPVHPQVILQRLSDYVATLGELGGMDMREDCGINPAVIT